MLSLAPFFGYIPHIVDEAEPVFPIVLSHTVISMQKTSSGRQLSPCRPTPFEPCGVFQACNRQRTKRAVKLPMTRPFPTEQQSCKPEGKQCGCKQQSVFRMRLRPLEKRFCLAVHSFVYIGNCHIHCIIIICHNIIQYTNRP